MTGVDNKKKNQLPVYFSSAVLFVRIGKNKYCNKFLMQFNWNQKPARQNFNGKIYERYCAWESW